MMSERSIFLAALDIDDLAERSAYLDQACARDGALRAQVEQLLKANQNSAPFMERPAPALVATVDEQPISERPGTMIGPYKLLEQIGEGGFGAVFMAEQQQPLRRKVALKVLKPGMDTRQVVARFEAERQALALMDHPHIAHILDGGETASGRPYFVMELVRGIPITDFSDQNHLPVRERLELFLAVAQAVQHAHQKGVIHRDLKPSNVLVTLHDDRPVVKVIDFGIAKATGQQLTEKTLFTNFAQMIGTPVYMSPEQAGMSGLDVDTRSDIYSLGVLLYELLTGTTPFDKDRLRKVGYDEIRRMIREEEPAKPSTRISTLGKTASTVSANRRSDPKRLRQLFRGELDWIVMKALEKDRNRRYETASAFAADVQRYLNNEAVQACPPSAAYRLRKFAQRNKRALATVALLGGTLVAAVLALAVSYAQTHEALGHETQARQELGLALEREKQTSQDLDQTLKRETQTSQELARTSYAQSIALAERQLSTGNVGRAEELLNACPTPHGWEWHFLKRRRYGDPPPVQHSNTVNRIVFSPNGRQLASGCFDGTIQIRDARTGRVLHDLHKEGAITRGLTYSADGRYLAAGHQDGSIHVWYAATGELLAAFQGHQVGLELAFSPGGQTLASASQDRSVKLWDLGPRDKTDADRLIRTLAGQPAGLSAVAFSPDGRRLLAACGDGTVKTWDVATGQETYSFRGQVQYGTSARFSADTRRLAWACWDGIVKVWDTATGREDLDLRTNTHWNRSVAFSPDGQRLAVAGMDGTVRLLDGTTGREMLTIYAHPNAVADVAFSPDGHRLTSASYDSTVRLWDATPLTGDPQARHCVTLTDHEHLVNRVVFSPDGRWLASASWDTTVKLWELVGQSEPGASAPGAILLRSTLRGHQGNVSGVAFSSDNRTLASVGWDNTLNLWDLYVPEGDSLKRRVIRLTRPHTNGIGFSPDGRLLALGQANGIALYDPSTGKEVYPFKPTPAPVPGLAFGSDGRLYSSGASDPTIKVWEVAEEKPIRVIRHFANANAHIAVSPDGRRLASGSGVQTRDTALPWGSVLGYTVKIWDAQTGALLHTMNGHVGYIWAVAFSPDGRYLASGSWDSTIKVWDVAVPEPVERVTLRGHAGFIQSLAFSPDGLRLASTSGYAGHGEIKIWDAALWEGRTDGRP
jgi:WD40 repeat protein/serine/threonine protein kinase